MRTQTPSLLAVEEAGKIAKSGKRELAGRLRGRLLYNTDAPDVQIQEFIHSETRLGAKKRSSGSQAALRNEISAYLFEYIEGFHIPTHFVGKVSDTEMLVRKTEPIPLSVSVLNTGDAALERLHIGKSVQPEFPIIEHYAREDDPESWVNEFHVYALNLATPDELKQINRIASKVNAIVRGLCDRRGLICAALTLSFGRYRSQQILTGELSPATCRFLDANRPADGDRFHPDREGSESALLALRDQLQLKV